MPNENQQYIQDQRAQGLSDDQIKQSLRSGGWSENDISQAFGSSTPLTQQSAQGQPPQQKKGSGALKAILIVLGIMLLLGLISAGALFFFVKDKVGDVKETIEEVVENSKNNQGDILDHDDSGTAPHEHDPDETSFRSLDADGLSNIQCEDLLSVESVNSITSAAATDLDYIPGGDRPTGAHIFESSVELYPVYCEYDRINDSTGDISLTIKRLLNEKGEGIEGEKLRSRRDEELMIKLSFGQDLMPVDGVDNGFIDRPPEFQSNNVQEPTYLYLFRDGYVLKIDGRYLKYDEQSIAFEMLRTTANNLDIILKQ